MSAAALAALRGRSAGDGADDRRTPLGRSTHDAGDGVCVRGQAGGGGDEPRERT